MSNEEIVRDVHRALASGNVTTMAQYLDPYIIFVLPGKNPFAGRYQGVGAVTALFTRVGEHYGHNRCTTIDLRYSSIRQQVAVSEIKQALVGEHRLQWQQHSLYFISHDQVTECWLLVDHLEPYESYWKLGSSQEERSTQTPSGRTP
jgi:hypothetical protein